MVDDDARRRGVERLGALIGEEEVRALMGNVPPFRWEELATKQDLREHFADMDERFNSMGQRFSAMEERFRSIEERFSAMEERFRSIEERFSAMDNRFSAMDERFTGMDDRFAAVNERLDVLQAVTQQTRTLLVAMIGTIVAVGSLAVALTQFA